MPIGSLRAQPAEDRHRSLADHRPNCALLLDDPTKGIDLSAKADLFALGAQALRGGGWRSFFIRPKTFELLANADRTSFFQRPVASTRELTGAERTAVSTSTKPHRGRLMVGRRRQSRRAIQFDQALHSSATPLLPALVIMPGACWRQRHMVSRAASASGPHRAGEDLSGA